MNKLSDKRLSLLISTVLAALTIATYCHVARFDFTTLDDPSYVTGNPHVRSGLTRESIAWALTATHSANWHPLTWISHMVDVQLFGLKPWGHHLSSVLFHVLNTLLLFVVLRRMTGCVWRSAFVAALFAVHPTHVESVAWVAERKDVLSTLFWLLTMLAYVRYVQSPGIRRYVPVALAFALGLMAKPMLVSLPLVLVLADAWPLGRLQVTGDRLQKGGGTSLATSLLEKLPLFALALASCVVTFIAQRGSGAVGTIERYSLGVRADNAIVSYVAYIGKMLWPVRLSVIYPHPVDTLPVWLIAVCAAALAGATYAAVRFSRSQPYLATGWLWYLATLLPVIGLVQVGQQAMADRYTYIPFIGLFIIIAWGMPAIAARAISSDTARRAALCAGAAVVLVALSVAAWVQVGYWRNGEALFKHALAATSGHSMVRCCLADVYLDQGKTGRTIEQLRLAIKDKPDLAEAHNGLGFALDRQGRTDEAVIEIRKAVELNPRLTAARNNLGSIMLRRGDLDGALEQFTLAVKYNPRSAEALCNLGTVLDRVGRTEEAIPHLERAVELGPDVGEARYALGVVLLKTGDNERAVDELTQAVELKPRMPEAHFSLAMALGKQGDLDEARAQLIQTCELKPEWGPPRYSLAVLLFQSRDYEGAWREARESRRLGLEPDARFISALSRKMPEPAK